VTNLRPDCTKIVQGFTKNQGIFPSNKKKKRKKNKTKEAETNIKKEKKRINKKIGQQFAVDFFFPPLPLYTKQKKTKKNKNKIKKKKQLYFFFFKSIFW
jgi:hypothetical protein